MEIMEGVCVCYKVGNTNLRIQWRKLRMDLMQPGANTFLGYLQSKARSECSNDSRFSEDFSN